MFQLDKLSEARLVGVHPDLVKVVQDCARNWSQPFIFAVAVGLRTVAQQRAEVAAGFSQTMKSRHLDGHAVDLAVLMKGETGNTISWAWPPFYVLAGQMRAASIRTKVPVIWGGVWDAKLANIDDDMELQAHAYVTRARAKGGKGFEDGPHFELPWDSYPSGTPIA